MALNGWVLLAGALVLLSPFLIISADRYLSPLGWRIAGVAVGLGTVGILVWNIVVVFS